METSCVGKLKAPVVKQKSFTLKRKVWRFFQADRKRGPMDYPSLLRREKSSSGFEFRRENGLAVQVFRIHLLNFIQKSNIFCLHYSTGTNNTTMFIYGRVGQPSHRAVYLTYMQICINIKYYINKRTEAPKPDTKTPKNQRVEKTRGTCTPDQCSGATLGVLGYASA